MSLSYPVLYMCQINDSAAIDVIDNGSTNDTQKLLSNFWILPINRCLNEIDNVILECYQPWVLSAPWIMQHIAWVGWLKSVYNGLIQWQLVFNWVILHKLSQNSSKHENFYQNGDGDIITGVCNSDRICPY